MARRINPNTTKASRSSRVTLSSKRAQNPYISELSNYNNMVAEEVTKAIDEGSNQRPNDDQETFSNGGVNFGEGIIAPPYNLYALAKLPNNNSILKQCIDVMVTNIESNGYRLEYIGEKEHQETPESKREYNKLKAFIESPNGDYSLTELRERIRQDYETFGNAYVEVLRTSNGSIKSLYHIPAHTMRVCAYGGSAPVNASANVRNADGNYTKKTYKKRFRRFVQVVNGSNVFFKELGDPRLLNPLNGKYEDDLKFEDSATEIYHFAEYNPGSPYGLPRWFNQLPAIMGSREAELTNLDYFQENAMPAMVVLVSGGGLTQESMEGINSTFTNIRGRSAQNRVLVIEAVGDPEAADDTGKIPAPTVTIKPLVDDRQGDGLFQNFEKMCADKIRAAFRIPPIFLGLSADYNRSTADRSLIVGESQIFSPERRKFDDFFNEKILSDFLPKHWRYKGLPPRASGTVEIMLAVQGLSSVGAITPNSALNLANEMLDLNLKPIEDEWGDRPFFITQAQAQHGLFGDIGVGENKETGGGSAPNPNTDPNDQGGRPQEVKTINPLMELTKRLYEDDNQEEIRLSDKSVN